MIHSNIHIFVKFKFSDILIFRQFRLSNVHIFNTFKHSDILHIQLSTYLTLSNIKIFDTFKRSDIFCIQKLNHLSSRWRLWGRQSNISTPCNLSWTTARLAGTNLRHTKYKYTKIQKHKNTNRQKYKITNTQVDKYTKTQIYELLTITLGWL